MSNGSFITKEAGKALIEEYQDNHPNAIKAEMYDGNLITEILDQTNVHGVRIYYGQQISGDNSLVIVGVDQDGKDITSGLILDAGTPCPTSCDLTSYFNS